MLQLFARSDLAQTRRAPEEARLFTFDGGVHLDDRKDTSESPIELLPPPPFVYLPLQQHAGKPSRALVRVGQRVRKGELIADAMDSVAAPIHASTSGTVVKIGEYTAPHPSGLACAVIVIESDGLDEWIPANPPSDPMQLPPAEVAGMIEKAGVVGLGGAVYPAAVKLRQAAGKVTTLIVNAAECEPYLTCDDRVMQERALGVIDGTRIILHALQAKKAVIGIEDNKPDAADVLQHLVRPYPEIRVAVVPTRFPTGSGKQLVQILTGNEVPAKGRSYDVGVVIHNVCTAFAVHRAVRRDRALVSRVVTVSGGAVREPKNVEVALGAPISFALDACGGLKEPPARLIMGGPMTGLVVSDVNAPIVKATNGILALSTEEVGFKQTEPCIRCGRCIDACPMGLVPMEMSASVRAGQLETSVEFGLSDCITCGTCSFVCPSHIPLVAFFSYAKSELSAKRADERRTEELRRRAELRRERLEREKQEKAAAAKAAAAARKAARAAKAKAAAAGAKRS